jgi:hypothetical protein
VWLPKNARLIKRFDSRLNTIIRGWRSFSQRTETEFLVIKRLAAEAGPMAYQTFAVIIWQNMLSMNEFHKHLPCSALNRTLYQLNLVPLAAIYDTITITLTKGADRKTNLCDLIFPSPYNATFIRFPRTSDYFHPQPSLKHSSSLARTSSRSASNPNHSPFNLSL